MVARRVEWGVKPPDRGTTMADAEREPVSVDTVESVALGFGRSVLDRDPTPEEAASLAVILNATAQALRHGFIRRMADEVAAERTDEAIEEFFEEQIDPT